MFLKDTGKMLRIAEAQALGRFGDSHPACKELPGTMHDETAYIGGSRIIGQLTDKVSEIIRRKEKLPGTIFDGRHTILPLKTVFIILAKQVFKTVNSN